MYTYWCFIITQNLRRAARADRSFTGRKFRLSGRIRFRALKEAWIRNGPRLVHSIKFSSSFLFVNVSWGLNVRIDMQPFWPGLFWHTKFSLTEYKYHPVSLFKCAAASDHSGHQNHSRHKTKQLLKIVHWVHCACTGAKFMSPWHLLCVVLRVVLEVELLGLQFSSKGAQAPSPCHVTSSFGIPQP